MTGRGRAAGSAVRLGILALPALLSVSSALRGEELIDASVERRGERFILHSEILIRIPEPSVRALLSRFEELPRINKGIKSVQILDRRNNAQARMRVVTEVCILLVCLDYTWVQEVSTLANGDIEAVIEPDASDFREGWTRYAVLAEGGSTRLIFNADLVPKFWFPPGLGPWLIKRKLASEALETAGELERLGQASP